MGLSEDNGNGSKMFLDINGIPVLGRSLLAFQNAVSIKEIVISARIEDFEQVQKIAEEFNITKLVKVCGGGKTRQESVFNALKETSENTALLAVHDGARPLIETLEIERVCKDARIFGGAILGVPVKDTVKVAEDGIITETPDRRTLFLAQTPQVFKRRLYINAVHFALEHGLDFTDDCGLVEAMGNKVYLTIGSYSNIKLTTPEDIAVARQLMSIDNV
jgi:2-C-methyl-D-erythritol 4-phosphate cytidylyltransferase